MNEPLRGPAFGSYAPEDVSWLLTDISEVTLEAPTEEREEAIQSGRAHYSESLPIEYQPSAEYYELYHDMVRQHAPEMAQQVAVVAEKLRLLRPEGLVLVSLARAGTPVGVLIKRYLSEQGLVVPHYAVSIIRGRGIDVEALNFLAEHYPSEHIMFIDGWTGKGAITKELDAAVSQYNEEHGTHFSSELAVLADPGHATTVYGTREDYLIPSACLNSTVSGLVSRTVYNTDVLSPGDYHGAKFYRHFAEQDVSQGFIEAVQKFFPQEPPVISPEEVRGEATFEGWSTVEQISEQYGINSVNLVKPGVGETTRVLLRRVPERVLINPERKQHLGHILMLCRERKILVEEIPGLVFSCVGIIEPKRGTGFDGKAVLTS